MVGTQAVSHAAVVHYLAVASRPALQPAEVVDHPVAAGPFGSGRAPTGPISGPPVTEVAVISPLVTEVHVIAGVASFRTGRGGIVPLPPMGENAAVAIAGDTAAKRFQHSGVIDQALRLNLLSLFAP